MNEEIIKSEDSMTPVAEPVIKFNYNSDRDIFKVTSGNDPNITLFEITGYGLQINFNMEYLRSIEDIQAATEGIGELFKEIILEKLLEYKQNA